MIALKEWGAAAHALLQGRQRVLLRRGGIHEKRFTLEDSRFLLYPTVAHSHAASTRPEHADLLPLGTADVTEGTVVVRAVLSVVEVVEVARPDRIAELAPLHIWTTESVRTNRIDFRPKHRLAAIVVSARPLPAPIEIPVRPEYGGCRSWVQLPIDPADPAVLEVPTAVDPAADESDLRAVAARVRAAVG